MIMQPICKMWQEDCHGLSWIGMFSTSKHINSSIQDIQTRFTAVRSILGLQNQSDEDCTNIETYIQYVTFFLAQTSCHLTTNQVVRIFWCWKVCQSLGRHVCFWHNVHESQLHLDNAQTWSHWKLGYTLHTFWNRIKTCSLNCRHVTDSYYWIFDFSNAYLLQSIQNTIDNNMLPKKQAKLSVKH